MVGAQPLVIEADGPSRFVGEMREPCATTVLKRRLLRHAGWQLISIPYWEWEREGGDSGGGSDADARLRRQAGHLERVLRPHMQLSQALAAVGSSGSPHVQLSHALENVRDRLG